MNFQPARVSIVVGLAGAAVPGGTVPVEVSVPGSVLQWRPEIGDLG